MRWMPLMRWSMVAICTIVCSVAQRSVSSAQGVATLVLDAAASARNDINQPFLLASVPNDVIESLDDYRRYCQRGQWEKAFKQLEKLTAAKAGLVPDKDGVRVPPSLLLVHLVSDLPAEGKKAFQLFHDADARSLMDQATGKDEAEKLSAVATQFLFTSSGDSAADRLGDLLFERGEFSRAMSAWRSILNYRPDSTIPQAQTMVKVAIAAARDGRWDEFQGLKRQLGERYADAVVTLGGQSHSAVEQLEKVATALTTAMPTSNGTQSNSKLRIPADAKPMWQFRWFAQVNPILGNREGLVVYDQMYGRQYASDFVPPVAIDDARLYSDMVGYDVGIDLATGKLNWRSGRYFDLMRNDNGQNPFNNGRGMVLERSGILCLKDRLWSVARDNPNQNSNDPRYNLIAREIATGKEIYNSKTAKDNAKEWTITGPPVTDGERLYIGAYKPNQPNDVYALCLSAADGKLLWNTKIGSYKNDQRNNYNYSAVRSSVPALLLADGSLYFDTHAGSLVQLNPTNGEIAWGINYDSDMPSTERYYNQPPEQLSASGPMMTDGVLYFKGMRSRRLYAIDPSGPKVLWSRPVSMSAVLCGVDHDRIYTGGQEITAYDLKTRQLLWSKQVPVGTGWIHPLMTDDRIYQFTQRGIYELDKASGEVLQLFRGADMDSLGGTLLLTPRALLAISNVAITAYPIEYSSTSAKRTTLNPKP